MDLPHHSQRAVDLPASSLHACLPLLREWYVKCRLVNFVLCPPWHWTQVLHLFWAILQLEDGHDPHLQQMQLQWLWLLQKLVRLVSLGCQLFHIHVHIRPVHSWRNHFGGLSGVQITWWRGLHHFSGFSLGVQLLFWHLWNRSKINIFNGGHCNSFGC